MVLKANGVRGTLKKRADVLAFMNVSETETPDFQRLEGFTGFSESMNPKEYSRQYVDEESEQTDVTGYAPSISFELDWYEGNPCHDFIVHKIGNFATGSDAVVTILNVDTVSGQAFTRNWALVPSDAGSSTDAFTYSGDFRSKGDQTLGTAVVAADGYSAEFTPYPSV